jgi:hypothetical protein
MKKKVKEKYKVWIKSGIKSLYVTIPIIFFISIVYGFINYNSGASFIIVPLQSLLYQFCIIALPIALIVALISYFRHRK